MIIVGLTGSIGMGKTTAANYLKRLGIPVHEADAEVHKLMAPGGAAVAAVLQAFPGVVSNGMIDRQKLGNAVFGKPDELARLEAILHPLVREDSIRWCEKQKAKGAKLVVLDIPLLYEIGRENDCDLVWVVSAPAFIQRRRVLARFGITPEKLNAVLARQLPDSEKRRRADAVIYTGFGHIVSRWFINRALEKALAQNERC